MRRRSIFHKKELPRICFVRVEGPIVSEDGQPTPTPSMTPGQSAPKTKVPLPTGNFRSTCPGSTCAYTYTEHDKLHYPSKLSTVGILHTSRHITTHALLTRHSTLINAQRSADCRPQPPAVLGHVPTPVYLLFTAASQRSLSKISILHLVHTRQRYHVCCPS